MNFYDVILAGKLQDVTYPANFFDLLFARKLYPADVWEIYEGTLPAMFNANGDDMRQYQVYGNTGGVGDRTVNLFDLNANNPDNGYAYGKNLTSTGAEATFSQANISEYISITPLSSYTFFYGSQYSEVYAALYNAQKEFVRSIKYNNRRVITFSSQENETYLRITYYRAGRSAVYVVKGTTAPATYIPFGYEVDISTSDGTNATTTPIYIGSDPLEKDEYVDYQAGKVYRRTENLISDWKPQRWVDANGVITVNASGSITKTLNVDGTKSYVLAFFGTIPSAYEIAQYDGTEFISRQVVNNVSNTNALTFEPNTTNIIIGITSSAGTSEQTIDTYKPCLTEGSTAPAQFVPYLQPTAPPVPLPALPTCEGMTIVDYAGVKAETTKNILPSAAAQTLTVNGNTCTCDGQGRYHVDMSNNTDTNFVFSIPDFTIPVSVGQGGSGTWSMFNTASQSMLVRFYYNDTEIDYWSVNAANRKSDSYSSMGGQTINKIIINAWNASVDGDFAFMFTNDGVLPSEFVPHEIAKPTPEKVLLEYKKG